MSDLYHKCLNCRFYSGANSDFCYFSPRFIIEEKCPDFFPDIDTIYSEYVSGYEDWLEEQLWLEDEGDGDLLKPDWSSAPEKPDLAIYPPPAWAVEANLVGVLKKVSNVVKVETQKQKTDERV